MEETLKTHPEVIIHACIGFGILALIVILTIVVLRQKLNRLNKNDKK